MGITNVEFKARVKDLETYQKKFLTLNPVFMGVDHQKDTYYHATKGRLKLREGNIENALIQYERENLADSKESTIVLYKHKPDQQLKQILESQFGIKVVVEKVRKIYFIENVKFHFDTISELGTFIEVEAIDDSGKIDVEALQQQCNQYIEFFGLEKKDMIDISYSDMILQAIHHNIQI